MKKGDLAFFYHSSCKVPAIVGIMEIVQENTPDCILSLRPVSFLITNPLQYQHTILLHHITTLLLQQITLSGQLCTWNFVRS
jgi:hypothetical protein